MELVSVVIPVHNRAGSILRAVQSVQHQTWQTLEILVVDDASVDGSSEMAEGIREPRLRVLRMPQNGGAAAARNAGIGASRGRWLAFLDSDDEWAPRKIETQLAGLRSQPPGLRASCTGYVIRHAMDSQPREFRPSPSTSRDGLLWGCSLSPGSTLVAERRCFERTGLFDSSLRRFEDWDWLLRFTEHADLRGEPEILATIHKDGVPSARHVLDSLAVMRAKHRRALRDVSVIGARKFESSLYVEEAAAMHYAGLRRQTYLLLARALLAYPLRNRAFFSMLARRFLSRFKAGRAHGAPSASAGPAPSRFSAVQQVRAIRRRLRPDEQQVTMSIASSTACRKSKNFVTLDVEREVRRKR